MLSLFVISVSFILSVFCFSLFSFMLVIIMTEVLNITLLLFSYLCCLGDSRIIFLIFIVVATIEVTVALVCLTRLWDMDCIVF